MDILLNDLTSLTYMYNILVGSYGFSIFLYWAIKRRGASLWYFYIMMMLFALVITQGFQLSARYFLLTNSELYDCLLNHPVWAAKSWISSIVMTSICIHASYRLWKCRKKMNSESNKFDSKGKLFQQEESKF